jgi:ComEC/Rec2-related protein
LLPFHFLAGQCTFGLIRLLPWDDRAWLLLLPAFFLVRGGSCLAFAAGGLWQTFWTTHEPGRSHPFFWFLGTAESAGDPIPLFFQQGLLDQVAGFLAADLQSFFLDWDAEWGLWFLRFGFGFKAQGDDIWPRIYEELGLLHVLVVSGAHFSFVGGLLQNLVEGPGRMAYALRLFPLSTWLGWVTGARLVITVLITIFALVVGFNPPCQRAWLGLLVSLWLPLIAAPLTDMRTDRLVFSLQALCFPGSFLSLSNALSWSAYTMVRYLRPWPKAWQRRCLPAVEGPLIAVNLSYFGTFSPWGLLLNTFLQPLWHIILGTGLLYWIWPEAWIGEGLRFILQRLHDGILYVHQHSQQNGPVRWEGRDQLSVWGRCLLWCAGSWIFFRLWRRREDACENRSSPVT